jgi:predicted secreted protein
MNGITLGSLAMACALFAGSAWVFAADTIESRPVHFAKGASSATLKGTLKGDKTIDYKLGAKTGQTMSVTLKTSNGANYFNVLPPGSSDVAVFVGSSGGNEWTGQLAADGQYTIRVYLMRSAARRKETANYTLTVGITGKAAPSLGAAPRGDARVKGTPYHATGRVPCAMGTAPQGSAQCDYGVIRGQPGNAEVHVTPPGGFKRVLTFIAGKVTADSGASVKATRSADEWLVDVNDHEHYRIPDAVISGG